MPDRARPRVAHGLVDEQPGSSCRLELAGNRQLPNAGRNVWLRIDDGYQPLHVSFASMTDRVEQAVAVVCSQVRRQKPDSRKRDAAIEESLEHLGYPARSPGRGDSLVRRMFRKTKLARAVQEQRGLPLAEVQLPGVDFDQ